MHVAKKKKSRKWLYVAIGIVAVVGLAVAARMRNAGKADITPVTTEKAIVKTITQVVSATGKIQPETEVKISPEVAGEIVDLPLKEGATVKKGDLLVKIKPDNYVYQLDQRQADLAAARAQLLDSKSKLTKAEQDFRRADDLFNKQLLSDSDFSAAKSTYEVAQAAVENANAQILRSEGLVKQAQDLLEKTTIYSPMDGTVSSRTSEVGERVVATGQFTGTEVMRVANLEEMEVRVNVNENDVVNVKIGDKARITIDAFPNRKFTGSVKEIAATAKTQGANTQEEVTNFQVKIRVEDRGVALRPGMSANADIETQTVANVVAVPIQSVTVRTREGAKTVEQLAAERDQKAKETQGEGAATAVNEKQQKERLRADRESLQRVVFVRDGDHVKQVSVETGIADSSHMEIKSGIKEGDEVVSGSFSVITRKLKDGMKVRIEKPKAPEKKS
ncbi:efflux RND transporter periplasmic adaptor subunit [Opitutaceae bacterium EW11]|nr:efflux RND transporter periplasmic adaptor subunit [Opitutaceae bacterium EW11]